MRIPEVPDNEAERLAALHATGLLHTPAEARFDRITRLARQLFGVQSAVISLVADDYQWFKSRQGLDVCQTSREISFCGHAILQDSIFLVEDARLDPRFADNPLVTGGPCIAFYAAAPLSIADDQRIGTLCVLDPQPRQPDAGTLQALRDLADLAEVEISRQQLQDQLQRAELAEQRLHWVIEGTHVGTWEWNVQSGETVFNQRWAEMVGYRLEELAPISIETWTSLAHPDDLQLSGQALGKHFSGESDYYDVICRMRHRDGHWVWVHDRGRLVSRTAAGEPLLMAGTHADVTDQVQARLALEQSESQFRTLVGNIPGITYRCLHDEHWTMLYISGEVDPLSGYPADEFIGNRVRSYQSIIHPDEHARLEREVGGAIARGAPWEVEYRVCHRDGTVRWAKERGTPVFDEQGQLQYMDGFILDITREKQLQLDRDNYLEALSESEQRLRGLFDLSPIGIALNDLNTGQFVQVNAALLAPTGYTEEEFLGLSYWEVTPIEYEDAERLQLISLRETGRYGPFEKEYLRKDGSRYPVLLNGMLVTDAGGRELIWSMIEDISERKRIDRMKNEFISTISHELRTPLTAVSGALSLLASGAAGELPGSAKTMVELAERNSQRLLLLISDLLDMEKLLAGKMPINVQEHRLATLLDEAIETMQPYAGQFSVSLKLGPVASEARVRVDAPRFQQIMANLLSNAIKFSPPQSRVDVELASAAGRWLVRVRDQGPGIPLEFQPQIFQKFVQADASDRRSRSGTGLGLAITHALCQRMGIEISFSSTPGEGTEFVLGIPAVGDAC